MKKAKLTLTIDPGLLAKAKHLAKADGIASGMYMLRVYGRDGELTLVGKVVKQ